MLFLGLVETSIPQIENARHGRKAGILEKNREMRANNVCGVIIQLLNAYKAQRKLLRKGQQSVC